MDLISKNRTMKPSAFTVSPCEMVTAVGFYVDEKECQFVPDYDCDVGALDCVNDCGLPDGIDLQLQFRVEADCGEDSCWVPFRRNGNEIIMNSMNNPIFLDGDKIPGVYRFFPISPLGDITVGVKIERVRKCR